MVIGEEERAELRGWLKYLRVCKVGLHNEISDFNDFFVISTDASDSGVGAVFHKPEGDNIFSKSDLTQDLVGGSSTIRELFGILHAIKSFATLIAGEKVQIQTDNQAAQSIFYKGSTKPDLQQMAHKIWDTIEKLRSDVEVYWIPRELNGIADFVSRIVDVDNWSILDSILQYLNRSWGTF